MQARPPHKDLPGAFGVSPLCLPSPPPLYQQEPSWACWCPPCPRKKDLLGPLGVFLPKKHLLRSLGVFPRHLPRRTFLGILVSSCSAGRAFLGPLVFPPHCSKWGEGCSFSPWRDDLKRTSWLWLLLVVSWPAPNLQHLIRRYLPTTPRTPRAKSSKTIPKSQQPSPRRSTPAPGVYFDTLLVKTRFAGSNRDFGRR